VITIAGESGSGKTTLANVVLGFLSPTSGQVLYQGKNIWDMPRQEWFGFRRHVQAIFQDPYGTFNPFYQVDEVFETLIKKFRLAKNRTEGRSLTEEALEVVGLRAAEILGKYPHQLSGGQRQRIMVARAFLLKPRLIVADEPVSMIDASLQVRVLDIFMRLKEEYGISFLYITHDLSTAYQISDDIVVLYAGSVMESGPIESVIQNPRHPYSQLLVSSIPVPDPEIRWGAAIRSADEEQLKFVLGGCKFYGRCAYGNERCTKAIPPLYEVEPDHYVACFRYEGEAVKQATA
jgi:peptide/nickel transport system ATP-binding protein